MENISNVYIALTMDGEQQLKWSFLKHLPIGAVLASAKALEEDVMRQAIGPAPAAQGEALSQVGEPDEEPAD